MRELYRNEHTFLGVALVEQTIEGFGCDMESPDGEWALGTWQDYLMMKDNLAKDLTGYILC